ncbi:MAG: fold metallo-hydrolase [Bradyrhizobium sp.]|nr:fold metallo-hydrolase [Bradyrhizobium sp.]
MHWNVGKVRITKIVELETVGSTRFILPLATNDEIRKLPWLIPDFATEEGRLKMSIHSLVVETPSRRIVVDTGLGNDKEGRSVPTWNNRKGPFLETMSAAGFPPDSIDTVLCTHLHVDHVGWNTRLTGGKWVPTFTRARYVFGRGEYEHWRDRSDEPDKAAVFNDSVKPVVDAGKADLVAGDARLADEITLIPTPGHSPGHMSILIRSDGEQGLLTGDVAHHPCQMAHLDWSSTADFRPRSVGQDTARIVLALCRYADPGDRRTFQRRPYQARRRCLQIHRLAALQCGSAVEFPPALLQEASKQPPP